MIPRSEFEFSFARSSGPGGQNVNKVNSKCILRWNVLRSAALPPEVLGRFISRFATRLTTEGDLVVMSDAHRDQKQNLEACVAKVEEMVALVRDPPKKRTKTKPSFNSREKRLNKKKRHGAKKAGRGTGGRGEWE